MTDDDDLSYSFKTWPLYVTVFGGILLGVVFWFAWLRFYATTDSLGVRPQQQLDTSATVSLVPAAAPAPDLEAGKHSAIKQASHEDKMAEAAKKKAAEDAAAQKAQDAQAAAKKVEEAKRAAEEKERAHRHHEAEAQKEKAATAAKQQGHEDMMAQAAAKAAAKRTADAEAAQAAEQEKEEALKAAEAVAAAVPAALPARQTIVEFGHVSDSDDDEKDGAKGAKTNPVEEPKDEDFHLSDSD